MRIALGQVRLSLRLWGSRAANCIWLVRNENSETPQYVTNNHIEVPNRHLWVTCHVVFEACWTLVHTINIKFPAACSWLRLGRQAHDAPSSTTSTSCRALEASTSSGSSEEMIRSTVLWELPPTQVKSMYLTTGDLICNPHSLLTNPVWWYAYLCCLRQA